METKAAIDIGTNSCRLLVADISTSGKILPLQYQERLTKLGAGLQKDKTLTLEARQRVFQALKEFIQIIQFYNVNDIVLFATSATRDASNQSEFIDQMRTESKLDCRILTGHEEALLSFYGVISDIYIKSTFLVCDVGGGSTEFIFAKGQDIQSSKSINFGSGRATRTYLLSDPVRNRELEDCRQSIKSILESEFTIQQSPERIICVGGSAATLALIDRKESTQSPEKAHHYDLYELKLKKIVNLLAKKSNAQRKFIVGLNPERADVILGGAVIIEEIIKYFGLDKVTISLRDLLFGILLENRYRTSQ